MSISPSDKISNVFFPNGDDEGSLQENKSSTNCSCSFSERRAPVLIANDFAKDFDTHEMELQKGDSIYIFSDGFIDQFGGEKGKKLKSKAFKKMLLEIQNLSMSAQKEYLRKAFHDWKGDLEQIDDVCVIGVRV